MTKRLLILTAVLFALSAAPVSAAEETTAATFPACSPAPDYSSTTSVVEYLQSGVEYNLPENSGSRGDACRSANGLARNEANRRCVSGDWSIGDCDDCYDEGDEDMPYWTCSVRWECVDR